MRNSRLIFSGILIGVLASLAFTQSTPSKRRYINLPGRTNMELPFSDAVLTGDTLYLAGRLGTDAQGAIPADTEKEIRNLLDGIKATLAEAKMTMDDLVTVQVFCPDLTRYDTFNAIYRTYFGKNFPARAFIGSGALLRGAHFEMQAIAVRQ